MGIPLDIKKAKTNKYHYVTITPRPEASSLHKNQGRWDSSLAVDVAGVIVTFHRPITDTGSRRGVAADPGASIPSLKVQTISQLSFRATERPLPTHWKDKDLM